MSSSSEESGKQMVIARRLIHRVSITRYVTQLLVVLIFFTAACSTRFIYPNLDWLIPWYLEDYLPMNRAQEASLQADLEKVLDWHCSSELIRYAEFLRKSARLFEQSGTVDIALIQAKTERMEQFFRDMLQRIGPDLAKLLQSASDEQIDTLFANLEKENRDLLQKHDDRSLQEKYERRQARMKRLLRKWIGDLTDEQLEAVNKWSKELDGSATTWIDNRRQMQQHFYNVLVQNRNDKGFPERLTTMLTTTDQLYSTEYRRISQQRRQTTFGLLDFVGSTLTAKQRTSLVDNLLKLADDMDNLRCS